MLSLSEVELEELAKEIYWAAYDQYIDSDYVHPSGFSIDRAWNSTSPLQRDFCRNQARRAWHYIKGLTLSTN